MDIPASLPVGMTEIASIKIQGNRTRDGDKGCTNPNSTVRIELNPL